MLQAFLVAAARTPIGGFGGVLASLTAPALGAAAIRAAVERGRIPVDAIEQVIMGNVIAARLGQAPARQAGRGAGIPDGHGARSEERRVGKECRL